MSRWGQERRTQVRNGFLGSALVLGIVAVAFTAIVSRGGGDSSSANPASTPVLRSDLYVAWLGDGYTAGTGTGGNVNEAFPKLVSDDLCWTSAVFGQGGTGYSNPGRPAEGESIYRDRIDEVVNSLPDLVIVQGSINDHQGRVGLEAGLVFSELRAKLPDVTIVAVGPLDPPKTDRARDLALRDAVREAASKNDVQFVDSIGWLTVGQYGADGAHPNLSGHREIANRLTAELQGHSVC